MALNVLVTGGAGYIGAHVAKALATAGWKPIVFDSLFAGHRDFVRWGPLIEADLSDRAALASTFAQHDIAAVIHLAGFIEVGESVKDPLKFFRNNVASTISLLQAMTATNVSAMVFSSSAAVYGMPESESLAENHPTRPVNPYGESKLMVERLLDWIQRAHGLRWCALRYFNAAGADPAGEIGEDHRPESHLLPRACLAALGHGGPLDIFGSDYPTPDGTAIRDYIHVGDLAQAHVRALERVLAGGADGALNLGTGRGHSVAEVIRAVEAAAGRSVPTRLAARRPGDPARLVADPTAARTALDWAPHQSDLDEIARTAWSWHVKRHGSAR